MQWYSLILSTSNLCASADTGLKCITLQPKSLTSMSMTREVYKVLSAVFRSLIETEIPWKSVFLDYKAL